MIKQSVFVRKVNIASTANNVNGLYIEEKIQFMQQTHKPSGGKHKLFISNIPVVVQHILRVILRLAMLHPDAPSTVRVGMYIQDAVVLTAIAILTAETITLHAPVQQYGIAQTDGLIMGMAHVRDK